nr:glycosyltransferase [Nitrosomonas oligotropha]
MHFQVGSEGQKESAIFKSKRFLFSPIQFFWRLIREKPHIVHLNTSLAPKSFWRDIAYLFVARIMGKKIVYQVHGGELPQVFFENRLLTNFLKLVLSSTDVVVLLAQEELRAYRNFEPNLHIEVIPNAIEIGIDAQWKKTPTAPSQLLRLVYVGRLAESKGIFEIIEALRIVRSHNKNIELVVAGSGPEEDKLRLCVKDLGLSDYVSFVGAVFGEEKKQIWEGADLFVFPTYHQEGLPYTLLESMAARTPPVISPVGAIPDVMEDGVHGVFVPSRNPEALAVAIERLDSDRALICSMGEAGRQRIENYYTVARLAGDFRNVYHNLLN